MQVLITSGGTTEKIDEVRGITNFATGSLGKKIAEKFLEENHQVVLLAGKTATLPNKHKNLQVISITDTQNLDANMKKYVPKSDIVVHSMAVSDYTPTYMADFSELEQSTDLKEFLKKKNEEKKISSSSENQVIFLKKNPKIISNIKKYNPNTILVGFKLLVDVSKNHLIDVAKASLEKNKADFILANDLKYIKANDHLAYLIGKDTENQVNNKDEIANLIYEKTYEKYLGEKNG